jgi:haloalkane dehalogenase
MVTLSDAVRVEYPWAGTTFDVDGGQMHVLDEGPRDGEVLLCVHGNPTWSFYWRSIVARFSDTHRVVVPDHMGCGLSDKPQDWSYRLADHVSNLERVVEALDLQRVTLIVHDWGGAIGFGWAARNADRVARLVVTNTAAFRSQAIPLSIASCRIPGFGALAVRGGNAFARVATWRATARGLSPIAKAGLLAPYDSWANRIATLRFVEDIPLNPSHPSYDALFETEQGIQKFTETPALMCWGDDDFCFTPAFRQEWQERLPNAEVHAWEDVGHYVMEDAPERVEGLLRVFLAAHPLSECA